MHYYQLSNIIIIIIIIITIIDLITLLSIYLLGNLHPSQTIGGLGSITGRKFILSPKDKWRVLETDVLYNTFVVVVHFAPLLRCFWLNLYSLDILGSFLVTTPSFRRGD